MKVAIWIYYMHSEDVSDSLTNKAACMWAGQAQQAMCQMKEIIKNTYMRLCT